MSNNNLFTVVFTIARRWKNSSVYKQKGEHTNVEYKYIHIHTYTQSINSVIKRNDTTI